MVERKDGKKEMEKEKKVLEISFGTSVSLGRGPRLAVDEGQ